MFLNGKYDITLVWSLVKLDLNLKHCVLKKLGIGLKLRDRLCYKLALYLTLHSNVC